MMRLLLCIGLLVHLSAAELIHVHVLYRHGDRTPILIYPNDPNQWSTWPDGSGQLTDLGKNEHFALGKFIRQRYNGLLQPNYNASEFYVRSTDLDRTLMSAESNLAGLFFPTESRYQFNKELKWNPIPVHTVPQQEDAILFGGANNCPRANQLMEKVYESPPVRSVDIKNQPFFRALEEKTGMLSVNLSNMWSIVDTSICEKAHNKSLPTWITPTIWRKMKQLDTYAWDLRCSTLELRRLRGGALLYTLLDHLQALSRKTVFRKGSKMIMYSGHDFTVSDLLNSAHADNGLMPPYATAVFVELHHVDSQYLVKFFLKNTTGEPYPLTVRGCTETCPVDQFARLVASEILHPNDYQAACRAQEERGNLERTLSLAFSFVCVVGVLCILVIIGIYIVKQSRYRQYRLMENIQSEEPKM